MYTITETEETLMKKDWITPPRNSKKKKQIIKNLKVSEAHTTRITVRYVTLLVLFREVIFADQSHAKQGYRHPLVSGTFHFLI